MAGVFQDLDLSEAGGDGNPRPNAYWVPGASSPLGPCVVLERLLVEAAHHPAKEESPSLHQQ